MLPAVRKIEPLPYFTPCKWQTVLLRNFGLVDRAVLARVLGTTEEIIVREAERLGIGRIPFDERWMQRGYITIIKNNWHLLPYEQLIDLLGMDADRLDYLLKEDDFLGEKLGSFKPYVDKVVYTELSETEKTDTERVAALIRKAFVSDYAKPFRFYSDETLLPEKDRDDSIDKIVYSYSMLYGDALMENNPVTDEYLEGLRRTGVNGIWLQGVLSTLSYYPFFEKLCDGYEIRRKNLNRLIEKCGRYGIKVYLYFNEPRGLSEEKFTRKTEYLKGSKFLNNYSLCTSRKEMQEYLYEAVRSLAEAVPELAGIISISMSENITNCYSREQLGCPVCARRKRQEVVAEVNNIMSRALKAGNGKSRLIANLWGWIDYFGWSEQDVLEGIALLDRDIAVMCVSEWGTHRQNGQDRRVDEYSMSQIGPSLQTEKYLSYARRSGHDTMAKVQVNNTWEFCVVPYIPVFGSVLRHMKNLKELGISGLMLSWTLGGYPTVMLDLASSVFCDGFDYDVWLKKHFGDKADTVKNSAEIFSQAFAYFPFNIATLYFGAQNLNVLNPWYACPTGLNATMVTFPYDQVSAWCGSYARAEFTEALTRMTARWRDGWLLLEEQRGNARFEEFKRFAEAFYVGMSSFLLQIRFNSQKETVGKSALAKMVDEEIALTRAMYRLAGNDCRIGYEASNHYYYTQNMFLEKLLNLNTLKILYADNV